MLALRDAADCVGLAPGLTVHDITAKSVAVGQGTLKAAQIANCVCEGIELLEKGKVEADGPERAQKYLQRSGAMKGSVPKLFWDQLEALAMHAGKVPEKPKHSEATAAKEHPAEAAKGMAGAEEKTVASLRRAQSSAQVGPNVGGQRVVPSRVKRARQG